MRAGWLCPRILRGTQPNYILKLQPNPRGLDRLIHRISLPVSLPFLLLSGRKHRHWPHCCKTYFEHFWTWLLSKKTGGQRKRALGTVNCLGAWQSSCRKVMENCHCFKVCSPISYQWVPLGMAGSHRTRPLEDHPMILHWQGSRHPWRGSTACRGCLQFFTRRMARNCATNGPKFGPFWCCSKH